MSKDRSLVRASDIGSWSFCNRAWWLANVEAVDHENPEVLDKGRDAHGRHGRQLAWSERLRQAGTFLITLALILAGLLLLGWLPFI